MENRQRQETIFKMKDSLSPAFLSDILTFAAQKSGDDSTLSTDILARLSRYLRYRLYDSNRKVVMLNSEVAFLENYLSLIHDSRQNFNYSVLYNGGKKSLTLPPSVIINITDTILDNVREGQPTDLRLEINTEQKSGIVFDFIVRSPGVLSAVETETSLKEILAVSSDISFSLSVRGGGGRLYVRVGINRL